MKNKNLLLSLLSVVLLTLPWYAPFSGLILLIAFVPLLFIEDDYAQRGKRYVIKYFALTFLLWNALTTWWIYKASPFGAVGAVIGNAAQMIVVFWLFHWVKRSSNSRVGYAFLVACWLAWEWFYFDAEMSWPWLVLGNGFAKDIKLIQWYEYTGTLGGSLWVWGSNIMLFFILRKFLSGISLRRQWIEVARWALVIIVPVVASLVIYYNYEEKKDPCHVLVLQPNIDPYNDKYGGLSYQQQVDIILNLAANNLDSTLDYVVAPETAFEGWHPENTIETDQHIQQIRTLIQPYPKLNFVSGLVSQRIYGDNEKPSATARRHNGICYDAFNTGMQVNRSNINLYHKSKLVVGVEMLPYPELMGFLGDWSIKLGGTNSQYGTQPIRDVYPSADGHFRTGIAICYEAIYGQYYSEFVRNGANIMTVISNDGWWGNTPGYRQLLYYSALRAVETRRSIARSANTGLSALINQRGDIVAHTNWWERDVLKGSINANSKLTFYVVYGDIIGRIAAFMFALMLLYAIVQRIRKKHEKII